MARNNLQVAYLENFNNKLGEFLGELADTFPEINDLRLLKSSFSLMRNLSERTPQKMFDAHVAGPFGDKINRRDESFFLNFDYTDVVASIAVDSSEAEQGLDIIGKLKTIWHTLDATNKDAIWKYLTVLMFLNGKCGGRS
jgi:hypothetical protein